MFPSLDLGPLSFPSYFTLLMLGFLAAIYLAAREAPRLGLDRNALLDLGMIAIIGGIVGSRILHVVADGYFMDYVHLCSEPTLVEPKPLPGGLKCTSDEQCVKADEASKHTLGGEICNKDKGTCHPGRDCLRVFKFWYGGLTYYGGFILAFGLCFWYVRRHNIPPWRVSELVGWAIPLGYVFGRLGCFLSGCCFGATTESWLGVHFPKGSPAFTEEVKQHLLSPHAHQSLAVLPTQLFHAAANLAIFLILFWMFRKRRTYDGKIFWWFVFLYGLQRLILEHWRGDQRGEWLWDTLSTSQAISLPMMATALVMMFILKRRARREQASGAS
jgi:phosphatidylglycerol:prolipoprotein diacylglycerol transferase